MKKNKPQGEESISKEVEKVVADNPELVVTAKDSILHLKCGAIDVHKKLLVAAVCITDPKTLTAQYYVKKFSTKNYSIEDMSEWFKGYDVKDVLMESTGKYWIPVFNILEAKELKPVLTHPKYVKQIKGKKTDIRDALHMANLFRMGHFTASFIPPADIRDIRDLCRYRLKLTYIRTSEKNRYQNSMTVSQVRLDSVLSDPFGRTASDIMSYLLSEDPEKVSDERILELIDPRVKASKEEILDSIHGFCIPQAQRGKFKVIQQHMDNLNLNITMLDLALESYEDKYKRQIEILVSHPGIQKQSAMFIIGEIGVDMSVWSNVDTLCSWAGVTPENNESANKKKSTRIGDGGHYLKPLLVQCALAAIKTPYFKAKYDSIKSRRGHQKAVIAIAHAMLTDIYYMLKNDEEFKPKDFDAVIAREKKFEEKKASKGKAKDTVSTVQSALDVLKAQGLSQEMLDTIKNQLSSQVS